MGNTIGGAGRRVAQGAQITAKMDSAPHGPVRKPADQGFPESVLFRLPNHHFSILKSSDASTTAGLGGSLDQDLPESFLFRWPNHTFSPSKSSEASTTAGSKGSGPGFTRNLSVLLTKP